MFYKNLGINLTAVFRQDDDLNQLIIRQTGGNAMGCSQPSII
jgi:hypothetical protein